MNRNTMKIFLRKRTQYDNSRRHIIIQIENKASILRIMLIKRLHVNENELFSSIYANIGQ